MRRSTRRVLIPAAAAAAIAAVAIVAAAFLAYRAAVKADAPPAAVPPPAAHAGSTAEIPLCSMVERFVDVKAPWDKSPISAEVVPPEGVLLRALPTVSAESRGWGETVWRVAFTLQPHRIGSVGPAKVKVLFRGADGKIAEVAAETPGFQCGLLPGTVDSLDKDFGKELKGIPPIPPPSRVLWILAAVAVLAAAAVVWTLLRRRKDAKFAPIIPPWAQALCDLRSLGDQFHAGKLNTVVCVTSLTDIVRVYLERRFSLHAPRQTTEEFLRGLDSHASPLKNTDRNFLRDFMIAAEMIKFANMSAPPEQIDEAIDRASTLVKESVPADPAAPRSPGESTTPNPA